MEPSVPTLGHPQLPCSNVLLAGPFLPPSSHLSGLCLYSAFREPVSCSKYRSSYWLLLIAAHVAAAAAKSLQLCPTLCDPIDGSPPGSPIPGILQARTLGHQIDKTTRTIKKKVSKSWVNAPGTLLSVKSKNFKAQILLQALWQFRAFFSYFLVLNHVPDKGGFSYHQ